VSDQDQLWRFLFEDAPLRGHWVRLAEAWREARAHQQLPAPVQALLGEALAAAGLLAGSLKFEGTLTLQLQGGNGLVSMLVAQATSQNTLRGVAHVREQEAQQGQEPGFNAQPDNEFSALVGDGQLVISIERGPDTAPWQGIVSMAGRSLADCLERYFEVSEQIPTRVVLAASDDRTAGIFLQKLPGPANQGEAAEARLQDLWDEARLLLSTVKPDELLESDPADLLARVFSGHDLRLFEGSALRFACRCGRERVATMLQSMGREEIDSIIAEQGSVTVTCEFCQRPYVFDAVDAAGLFVTLAVDPPDSVN
jgi:molecular chaperone Hsp33